MEGRRATGVVPIARAPCERGVPYALMQTTSRDVVALGSESCLPTGGPSTEKIGIVIWALCRTCPILSCARPPCRTWSEEDANPVALPRLIFRGEKTQASGITSAVWCVEAPLKGGVLPRSKPELRLFLALFWPFFGPKMGQN